MEPKVSIHAPYAGSDNFNNDVNTFTIYVSIHAPYAGSDVADSRKVVEC